MHNAPLEAQDAIVRMEIAAREHAFAFVSRLSDYHGIVPHQLFP
jgi:hypothetical protein